MRKLTILMQSVKLHSKKDKENPEKKKTQEGHKL